MAKTAAEKQAAFIEAIKKCTDIKKLLKMNITDAAPEVVEAFNTRKTELELDDGLVELTNGADTVRAHPTQVPHWKTQGWVETEAEAK